MSEKVQKGRGRPRHTAAEQKLAQQGKEVRKNFATRLFSELRRHEGNINGSKLERMLDLEPGSVSNAVAGRYALKVEDVAEILFAYVRKSHASLEVKMEIVRLPLELSLDQSMNITAKMYEINSEIRDFKTAEKLSELKAQLKKIESEIEQVEIKALQEKIDDMQKTLEKLNLFYYKKTGEVLNEGINISQVDGSEKRFPQD